MSQVSEAFDMIVHGVIYFVMSQECFKKSFNDGGLWDYLFCYGLWPEICLTPSAPDMLDIQRVQTQYTRFHDQGLPEGMIRLMTKTLINKVVYIYNFGPANDPLYAWDHQQALWTN